MRKPNDIKRPNPTKTKTRSTLPEPISGVNRLFRYRDGTVHQVVLGDRRQVDPATGEWVTVRGAVYLKRVSERASVIAKKVRQFNKRRKNEEANTGSAAGGVIADEPYIVGG